MRVYLVDDVPVVELRGGLVGDLEVAQRLRLWKSAFAEDSLNYQRYPCSILKLCCSGLFDLEGGWTQLLAISLRDYLQAGQPSHYLAFQLEGHLNVYNLNTRTLPTEPIPNLSPSIASPFNLAFPHENSLGDKIE